MAGVNDRARRQVPGARPDKGTSRLERPGGVPPSSPGTWHLALGTCLILLALLRGSVNDTWDIWDTVGVAGGSVGLLLWGVRQRGALRQRARARGVRYGTQALAGSLALLAILALVNVIAARHNRSFDLTESGLFTLSSETRQALQQLPRDVRLLAFFPAHRRAQAADLLRRYAEGSRHVQYELIDPDQDPELAQRYGVTAYGTVVVDVVRRPGQPAPSGRPVRVEADTGSGQALTLSEEKLTNALLKVTRGGTKSIYFLEGHGEADIASPERSGYTRARAALEGQAFVVRRLDLARAREVPADCSVLVIAGPSLEPFPAEISAVERYLQHGGKALVMVDPAPGVGLDRFLDRWGVQVGHDLVIDTSGAGRFYSYGPAVPLVKDYDGRHPITRSFRLTTFFPLARSLRPKENPGDAEVWPLAQTSPESFAEPYSGSHPRVRFDPARDHKGPDLLAVAVTRPAKSGREARLVVVGDSDFISNAFFDQAGNGDFFLAAMNWLAEEEELIALRPRPRQDRRVQLTDQQARGIFWLVVVALPLAALSAGVVVQYRRR
jgi:ABC-type uncharacterized transport system involved in gliding motility auxiliary subunit